MGRGSFESRLRRLMRLSDGPYSALTVRYGRSFLAEYPDVGPAWVFVGRALVELARYEEAEQAFAKALEFYPPENRQSPLAQMGLLFKEAGDHDQAATWFRRAIEADPGDAKYLIFLGGVLAKQGRFLDAEEAFRAAVLCTEGPIEEANLNLGLVLRARERYSEAADAFREAIRLAPKYRSARIALRDVELCMKLTRRG